MAGMAMPMPLTGVKLHQLHREENDREEKGPGFHDELPDFIDRNHGGNNATPKIDGHDGFPPDPLKLRPAIQEPKMREGVNGDIFMSHQSLHGNVDHTPQKNPHDHQQGSLWIQSELDQGQAHDLGKPEWQQNEQ